MKKIIKTILIILNLILTLIFLFNVFSNVTISNITFILAILLSITTQIVCLDKFKFSKKLLFVLLSLLLTIISTLISFLVTGLIFPCSSTLDIAIFTAIIGFLFTFINFTIFYTYLMVFVNKLKEKEKTKSSFVKLLIFYPLIVTILETLIMIFYNKV